MEFAATAEVSWRGGAGEVLGISISHGFRMGVLTPKVAKVV